MQRGLRAGARVMRHLCPTNHPNVRHISAGIRHTGPDPANQGWPGPWCWVINYDRTQIPDLETPGTGGTCYTGTETDGAVTSVCIAREGDTALVTFRL